MKGKKEMAKLEYDMNNIRLQYRGYKISIAQHSVYDPQTISERDMYVEEIAVKTEDGWEIVYHPAPNDADDYIVGLRAAKKFIDTLHSRYTSVV